MTCSLCHRRGPAPLFAELAGSCEVCRAKTATGRAELDRAHARHQAAGQARRDAELHVVLVACGDAKRWGGWREARDLYRSATFTLARRVAEQADAWHILSARHGLVDPATMLRAYHHRLPRGGDRRWSERVAVALATRYGARPLRLTILAGADYAAHLVELALPTWRIELPLQGAGLFARNTILANLTTTRRSA